MALALVLTACCAEPGRAQTPAPAANGFQVVWSRSVPPLIAAALSPQGDYVAMITQSGKLALWEGPTGKPLWAKEGVSERNIAVSDQMGYVLVYDELNPLDRSISLYRGKATPPAIGGTPNAGAATPPAPIEPVLISRRILDGAIWDLAVSLDGSHAACGTGDRKIYLIDLETEPKIANYPVDGLCNDLQFSGDNRFLAIGLWNQSGVEAMDMSGHILWSYLASNNRRYEVAISPDSRKVLAIAYLNHLHSDPVLSLLDDQGAVRWTYRIGANAYDPTVRVGELARTSFVSFTRAVTRGREITPERSLIALGPLGDELWVKGGLFFSPTLISLTPGESGTIAFDEYKNSLYRLSDEGQVLGRLPLSGQPQFSAVSRDGKRLLIYTSDGQLSLIAVQ